MKNIVSTLFVFLFVGVASFAQEEENKPDTMKVDFGDKTISIIDRKIDSDSLEIDDFEFGDEDDDPLTYWGGIDIGVNQMLNANGGLGRLEGNEWLDAEPIKSMHFGFNLFEQKIKIVKNHVGLVTGLGFAYNSFGLADSVRVIHDGPGAADSTFAAFDSDISYSKNKLRTSTLRIPVLLEFNTSEDEDRNFHISAGVYGGWRYSTINKIEFKDQENGEDVKLRRKDDFNMTDFTLDATARIGYRGVTLFANYGLTPLFEDGKGPEVYPVTVGINLINF